MYTKIQKPRQIRHSEGTTAAPVSTGGVPNSAMAALLGLREPESGFIIPDLAAKFDVQARNRARQNQIHAAESEADRLSAGVSSGSPADVRAEMGEKLGVDFSAVRFHTDTISAARAEAMGARAWTQGRDVFFGAGGFDPATAAHELVHTVQQGAVAGGADVVSAPAGVAQMDPPDEIPEENLEKMKRLKAGRSQGEGRDPGTAVGSVKTGNGQKAVLKMGAKPLVEATLAAFYNVAGEHYKAANHKKGDWTIDAPEARGMTMNEIQPVSQMIENGTLRSSEKPFNNLDEFNWHQLQNITIFNYANGKTHNVPDPNQHSSKPLVDFGKDEKNKGYQRAMGFMTLLDLVQGNGDRMIDYLGPQNWIEDKKNQQIHLIDNDHNINYALAQLDNDKWLEKLIKTAGPVPGQQGASTAGNRIVQNLEGTDGQIRQKRQMLGITNTNTETAPGIQGIDNNIEMLPKIYEDLKKKFGDKPNSYQKELLDRINTTYEYLTNAEMAKTYEKINNINLKKGTLEYDEAEKAQLFKELDRLRKEAELDRLRNHNHSASASEGVSSD